MKFALFILALSLPLASTANAGWLSRALEKGSRVAVKTSDDELVRGFNTAIRNAESGNLQLRQFFSTKLNDGTELSMRVGIESQLVVELKYGARNIHIGEDIRKIKSILGSHGKEVSFYGTATSEGNLALVGVQIDKRNLDITHNQIIQITRSIETGLIGGNTVLSRRAVNQGTR